ncbi:MULTISPECIES: ABC transporter ATP-binding protein [unclassified Erwinia]|uniref:ABC transporter ATP-binding protein n=1 Tax=unclassified Erwinia TaxID=2622719 RepID=UPI0006F24CB3|nr:MULTISPECIES: ABC transporter ATP-binding protein [unclassified Erwinia]KQN54321.1 ABC transporter [Erwinia sp. Leaf53]PLV54444.1 ABC transporter [Erwinia sp. B116]
MQSQPLLSVQQLRVTAGSAVLVDDISFTLNKGEVLGLIGESGAGKSTIGQAILGHCRHGMKISGGQIIFAGQPLNGLSERQMRSVRGVQIAYVAQSASASFNPAKTIGEQVIEVAVRHRVLDRRAAIQRAMALFVQLQLPQPQQFFHRYPHQVSGGQLQRAMIAMAICAGPQLIIFDEPTTALDVTTQLEVLKAIQQVIAQSGVAALYISHDLAVVAQLSQRIMVLRHGRQVETGATPALLDQPQQAYTRELLHSHAQPHTPRGSTLPLLAAREVSVDYQGERVLHNVSLTVGRGRTLALIGESGAGKSTLGRAICGLVSPAEGEVRFNGQLLPPALRRRSRQQLQWVQMIHQHPDTALNPRLTIRLQLERAMVCLTALTAQQRKARVETLLEQVGLPVQLADRYPHALSGGQKQRVCIARALAVEPLLIVCDEPTSALDPLVGREVLALLKRLQEQTGVSLLFITHDLHVVNAVADEVMVLRHGRTVRQGALDLVFNAPLDDYTAQLLRAVPQMRAGWLEEVSAVV